MKDIKDMNLEEVRQKIYEHALAINNDELYSLLDRLDELTRWIPVSERMPENMVIVFCYIQSKKIVKGYYFNGTFSDGYMGGRWYRGSRQIQVTHWKRITPPEGV